MANNVHEYDPKYDFKVPEFETFSELDNDQDESELSKYFEFDHENNVPIDLGFNHYSPKETIDRTPRRSLRNTPARQKAAEVKANESKANTEDAPSDDSNKRRTRSMGAPDKSSEDKLPSSTSEANAPRNLCTDLSDWNKKKTHTVPVSHKPPARQATRNLPPKAPVPSTSSAAKSSKVLSTEERELEKIKQLREEVTKKRRLAEKSHKRALSGSSAHRPLRSTHVTTVSEFNFATDKRVAPEKAGAEIAQQHKNFMQMLRKHQPEKTHQPKGPTVPIETNLYKLKRKATKEVEEPPLWSKTPERFHSLPRGAKYQPAAKRRRSMSMDCKITVPVTPQFEAPKRARRVNVPSHKDLEEKEVEEVRSYRFKARPLPETIFQNHQCGLPRKVYKEPTVAVSPKFATNQRISQHNTSRQETRNASFHARPIPKGMLNGPTGVKDVAPSAVTVPQSPAFALKNRLRSNKNEADEDDHIIRANPMPDLNKKFEPKIQRSQVRTEPFSFDERDQSIPERKRQLMREEDQKLQKMREFHARSANVLEKEPFIPKPSNLPLTDVTDVKLNTELRSSEREQWEVQRAATEQELAMAKREQERLKEEKERQEVQHLRRQAVHHAQPIRSYKAVQVKRSMAPLTRAQSPHFSKRLNRKSHTAAQSNNSV